MRSLLVQPQSLVLALTICLAPAAAVSDSARLSNAGGSPPKVERPNFVLVVADDLDGLLGSVEKMPTVQAMMVAGTTFTRYMTPTSLCCPARTTILRGQYVHNHGVYSNNPPSGGFQRFQELELESTTLAPVLADGDYRTALFGKYLNGFEQDPNDLYKPKGWSEWFAVVDGGGYDNYTYTLNENGTLRTYFSEPEDYLTDVLAGHAEEFILRSLALGKPFFLYFAPYAPHAPATPAERHEGLFPFEFAPRTPSFNEDDVSDKPTIIRELPKLSLAEIFELDAFYRDRLRSLQAIDEALGGLIDLLAAQGELDSTYFLFTTDNGFHMGQHRIPAIKYFAYEEDILGPLVVMGPGVEAGREVTEPANAADLAPTLLELAGEQASWEMDGRSLAPLWGNGPTAPWRAAQLLEQYPYDGSDDPEAFASRPSLATHLTDFTAAGTPTPTYVGLRTDQIKYVEWDTGEREVYFLNNDPDELDNRAGCASPALLAQLSAATAALFGCAGPTCRDLEAVPPLFADGFECGGLQAWSDGVP